MKTSPTRPLGSLFPHICSDPSNFGSGILIVSPIHRLHFILSGGDPEVALLMRLHAGSKFVPRDGQKAVSLGSGHGGLAPGPRQMLFDPGLRALQATSVQTGAAAIHFFGKLCR